VLVGYFQDESTAFNRVALTLRRFARRRNRNRRLTTLITQCERCHPALQGAARADREMPRFFRRKARVLIKERAHFGPSSARDARFVVAKDT
jgi:hypothetical protein